MKTFYDNTMISDYKQCPRYHYLRHVLGIRREGTAMPLVFGLCWHSAMEAVWNLYGKIGDGDLVETAFDAFMETWKENGLKPIEEMTLDQIEYLAARTPMTGKEMIYNYIEKRRPILDEMELIASERPFAVPLYPDSTDHWYIGRKDKLIKLRGDIIIVEHKTTSEYKKDGGFKSSFTESFSPNSQVEGYLYSENVESGGKVRYLWVDAALVHKTVHDAFKFIPIHHGTAMMDAWLWEVRTWINRINYDLAAAMEDSGGSYMQAFPRNTSHCQGKYGQCGFMDICRSVPNPAAQLADDAKEGVAPPGYMVEKWEPFDLLGLSKIMEKE